MTYASVHHYRFYSLHELGCLDYSEFSFNAKLGCGVWLYFVGSYSINHLYVEFGFILCAVIQSIICMFKKVVEFGGDERGDYHLVAMFCEHGCLRIGWR